jgi:hypothetical protein
MIAKLDSQNTIRDNFNVSFDYHESKVERGVSEKIYHNVLSDELKDQKEMFNYILDSNKKVKIKGFDIPFAFDKDDLITNESFLNVWDAYAKQMEMDNHPVIIYRDYDTEHVHFHVLVTNLSFDLEVNKKLQGFYKKDSTRLCREIEKEFGFKELKQMSSERKQRISSKDNQAQLYSYLSVMEKTESSELISLGLSEKKLNKILSSKPKNDEIFNGLTPLLRSSLTNLIESKPYYYQSRRVSLVNKLDAHLKNSDSNASYFKLLDADKSIYRRILIDRKTKKPYIRYGLKPGDQFFNEIDLPPRFTLKKVNEIAIKKVSKPTRQQEKKYLKNIVAKAYKNSTSYEDFKETCLKSDVLLMESKNSGGLYGVSFLNSSIDEGSTFKGSELGYGFNTLNESFDLSVEPEVSTDFQEITEFESPGIILPEISSPMGKTREDDEEVPLKKRKKGKKR